MKIPKGFYCGRDYLMAMVGATIDELVDNGVIHFLGKSIDLPYPWVFYLLTPFKLEEGGYFDLSDGRKVHVVGHDSSTNYKVLTVKGISRDGSPESYIEDKDTKEEVNRLISEKFIHGFSSVLVMYASQELLEAGLKRQGINDEDIQRESSRIKILEKRKEHGLAIRYARHLNGLERYEYFKDENIGNLLN